MYIMQGDREALKRMLSSFADEYGLTIRTRDSDENKWLFSFYKNEVKMKPEFLGVKWDEVRSIYSTFQAIVENVLRNNPTLDAIRVGRMMYQGFMDGMKGSDKITIKDVMFKPPATIVFWSDGSKTVVKTQKDDKYDPEKGLAMAISKRFLGNSGSYYNIFAKWLEKAPNPYCGFVFQPPVYAVEKVSEDGKIHTEFARRFLGKWKKQESQN